MPGTARRKRKRRHAWADLPDGDLLQVRLRDLDLKVEGTWVADCLTELNDELAARGLKIRPHAWISDEWFSPDSTIGIAIPFYLAHPRLMRLERKKLLEVEGGTRAECLRILRHEAGHVVQHAFRLNRRRSWQKVFGKSSRYPNYYRPDPASRNYVQHLRLWYAQSHPDEDFAETFAVWLSRSPATWRKRYAGWGALKKLEYVDRLMGEIAGARPTFTVRRKVDPLSRLSKTLGEHYEKKLAHYSVAPTTTWDRDLKRIFSDNPRHTGSETASAFIRKNRARIRRLVSRWTGEYELTLDAVLDEMIQRSRELKLKAVGPERKLRLDFTVLLTARTVHSLYSPSRRQWFAL